MRISAPHLLSNPHESVPAATSSRCPVCGGSDVVDTARRERLPAMQNYVYRTRDEALEATEGQLVLAVCRACGFGWNRTFDPGLLVYDEGYDNAVPSRIMADYYREIVDHLRGTYDLEGGLVLDVGCGDGTFLRAICDAVPGARGLGVDPALSRDCIEDDGRIVLIKDIFSSQVISERPALIVSRHVLEHIPDPVAFLRTIGQGVAPDRCPCFFEVPDLAWILDNHAFWDICYEHCNYFTASSGQVALRESGFMPTSIRAAFGSQYLWLEAWTGATEMLGAGSFAGVALADEAVGYAAAEAVLIERTRERMRALKSAGSQLAVWGMATKGVLFSLLVDPDAALIDFCIDINPNKQGCFVPVSGHAISAPDALRSRTSERPLEIVMMNENYISEIARACSELGIAAHVGGAAELID